MKVYFDSNGQQVSAHAHSGCATQPTHSSTTHNQKPTTKPPTCLLRTHLPSTLLLDVPPTAEVQRAFEALQARHSLLTSSPDHTRPDSAAGIDLRTDDELAAINARRRANAAAFKAFRLRKKAEWKQAQSLPPRTHTPPSSSSLPPPSTSTSTSTSTPSLPRRERNGQASANFRKRLREQRGRVWRPAVMLKRSMSPMVQDGAVGELVERLGSLEAAGEGGGEVEMEMGTT